MPFQVTVKDGPPLTAARGQALKMGPGALQWRYRGVAADAGEKVKDTSP
jgi:hypothetical protein